MSTKVTSIIQTGFLSWQKLLARHQSELLGQKYSELSLFWSPMGLLKVAGIMRWPPFRVSRDTHSYIRDGVTCIFSSMRGHYDWLVTSQANTMNKPLPFVLEICAQVSGCIEVTTIQRPGVAGVHCTLFRFARP